MRFTLRWTATESTFATSSFSGSGQYPEPMLSYCTNLPNAALASGVINLVESPRYGDLYLPEERSGQRWLHQDEIAEEEQRLHMALPYFFARPERTGRHGSRI
jgi:hypothetical protein